MFVSRERWRGNGGYSPFLLHWDIFFPLDFLLLVGITWFYLKSELHFLCTSQSFYLPVQIPMPFLLLQPFLWTAQNPPIKSLGYINYACFSRLIRNTPFERLSVSI